jgi:hypothetical protein
MSESVPDFTSNPGPERPDLSCLPESFDKFTVHFASHGNKNLKDSLQEMMHAEITVQVPAKIEGQQPKVIHVTPLGQLEQGLRTGSHPDWDIIIFSATHAGMIPQGETPDQIELRQEIFVRLENAYRVYHQSYYNRSGQPDVDRIIELYQLTDEYDDAALITIIGWLRQHMRRQSDTYFMDAERIVRILILEDILDEQQTSENDNI